MFLTLILASLLAIVFILYIIQPSKHLRKYASLLPGPPTVPILGNVHKFGRGAELLEMIVNDSKTHGKDGILRYWIGPLPVVFTYTPDKVEALLNSSKHMSKSYVYNFLHPWLNTGLLTSTGEKWKSRRKLLTPTFHFKILVDFVQIFWEQSETMVTKLEERVDKGPFDIFPYVTHCALDIICETAMGKNVNAQGCEDSEYVDAVYKITELIQDRQISPWKWPDFLYRLYPSGREFYRVLGILHGFTEKVIQERSQDYENKSNKSTESDPDTFGRKKRLAFLDLLLETSQDGAKLSNLDIREEVDTFMFEGHDTTAAAISWAIHLIGAHPEIQSKLHEEIDRVWGSDSRIDMDNLKGLKYLECTIKESLRLFPSVPIFARIVESDYEVGGYTIPTGVNAGPLVYALHRNPDVFPDPEKFDPDRFLPENCVGRHPFAYIPFSAGLRNCIGQKFAMLEEKVMLASLLKTYSFKSEQKRDDLRPLGELILRPENGIIVSLQKRDL